MFQKRFLFQLGICCNLLVLSVWFTTRYWRFHMSDTRPLATASYSGERFRIQFRKLICISNNALSAFLPGSIWCLGMCLCVSAVFLLCTNMRFWTISYGETTYPLHSQKKCCFLNSIFQNKLSIFLEKFYQIITRSDLIKHDVISCLVCNPLPVPWILHEVSTSQNHAQKTIIPCINIHSTIFLSVNKSQAFYKPTMKTVSAK